MNTSRKSASKVVWVLSVMKWCLVVWFLLGGAAVVQALWSTTDLPVSLLEIVGAAFVLGAVLAWAFVGWFQHMLGQVALSNDLPVDYIGGPPHLPVEPNVGGPRQPHFRSGGNLGTGRPSAGEGGISAERIR